MWLGEKFNLIKCQFLGTFGSGKIFTVFSVLMQGKAADYHGWLECMIRVIKMSRYLDEFCQSEAYTKRPKSCPFLFLVRQATRAQEKTPGRAIFSYLFLFYFILFYSSTSSLSESDYVHHVFSIVPALLALAGSLMVLFFRPPSCRTKRGWYRFKLSMQLCLIIS